MLTSYGSCWHSVELAKITGAVVFVLLNVSECTGAPEKLVVLGLRRWVCVCDDAEVRQ